MAAGEARAHGCTSHQGAQARLAMAARTSPLDAASYPFLSVSRSVYIPDFLDGDDFTQAKQKDPKWEPDFPSFLAKHHPGEAAAPSIRAAVDEIRKEQGDKVRIGAVGYVSAPSPSTA
jgi:hypothetical protein